jgi:hypothetical protein
MAAATTGRCHLRLRLENDAAGRSRSAGTAACRCGERGEHDNEGDEDLAGTRHDELHSVGSGKVCLLYAC